MRRHRPLRRLLCLLAAALFLAALLPAVPVSGASLADDPFAYQVLLEGTVYTLPCPVSKLADAGWQTDVSGDEPFGAGLYGYVEYQKDGAVVTATVANLGVQASILQACSLVGLAVQQNAAAVELAGGTILGASREQVLAVFGAPDRQMHGSGLGEGVAAPGAEWTTPNEGHESDTASPQDAAENETGTLRYTTGRHSFLQFTFDGDDLLWAVELQNLDTAPAQPAPASLPAEVQGWAAPATLGDSWQAYTVDYAGALYTLPAPVSAFMQNGWHLADEAALQPGQWLLGVRLQKGNQTLRTRVQNLSGEETELAGCFVTEVESSSVGADVSIRLPGGITRASTKADIETAWGPPHGYHQSATALTWLYYGENGKITCQFWNDSEELYALTVEHTSLS